jgi:hypothetical protein
MLEAAAANPHMGGTLFDKSGFAAFAPARGREIACNVHRKCT